VSLKVDDVAPHGYAIERATVRQNKTGLPVRFEITEQTRQALDEHVAASRKRPGDFLFHSRRDKRRCLSTRQYARLLAEWIAASRRFAKNVARTLAQRRSGGHQPVKASHDRSAVQPAADTPEPDISIPVHSA
jgi:integrase